MRDIEVKKVYLYLILAENGDSSFTKSSPPVGSPDASFKKINQCEHISKKS